MSRTLRVLCAIAIAGCWHGAPEPTSPPITVTDPVALIDEPAPPPSIVIIPVPTSPPVTTVTRVPQTCDVLDPAHPCPVACPSPPDPAIPACQRIMPCPEPPDHRIKACRRIIESDSPPPQHGRIISTTTVGQDVIFVAGVGQNQGITKTWTARICDEYQRTVPGGSVTIVRVDRSVFVGKTPLPIADLQRHPFVCLSW